MDRKVSILVIVMATIPLLITACSGGEKNQRGFQDRSTHEQNIKVMDATRNDVRIPIHHINGNSMLSIDDISRVAGYQLKWIEKEQALELGGIDPVYKIIMGQHMAFKEEEQIQLADKPMLSDGKGYVPLSILTDLFHQDLHYQIEDQYVVMHAVTENGLSMDEMENNMPVTNPGQEPFFQDDPEDPFKGDIPEVNLDYSAWKRPADEQTLPAALPNIDINALIQTAMKYRGVPYLFGAAPYPESRKFDCSSFTQYVFGKYGIQLRRVSRNQATQGVYVSRKNLRKGDLVFFAVPGRFTSDKIVGHVGIYIGNGKMINTYSNKNGGVHITTINTGYWSTKYLTARRVAY